MRNRQQIWMVVITFALMLTAGVAGVAAQDQVVTGAEFRYTLTTPGSVSAAVYDNHGAMVRTLLYGEKQQLGDHRLWWDGLDSYGHSLPVGKYEWRLLRTPGFTREFLLDVGTNITWRPHDYWPGNHDGPSSVMVDDAGALYVGAISSEGPPHMIKLSQDGRQLYWTTGTWGFARDGLLDMAKIGQLLYILMNDGTLQIWLAEKGGLPWGDPQLHKLLENDRTRGQFADLRHPGETSKTSAMRMAGGKDFLAVCYRDFNEVRLLWPQGATFARDETVSVPAPTAATVAPDGRIFVRSETGIVMFNIADRQLKTVVNDKNLLGDGAIAYDPAFDDILAANGSNVRRYHVADGKLVAVYGRPGGRTYGVFNPLDFDTIRSLCADGKGGFFTAELCPRRVAHFSGREKHALVAQWFGGMGWEWQAVLDPADPTVAYVPIDYKHLGRAIIDYPHHSWTLTHLYETPETFSWGANAGDQHAGVFPSLVTTGNFFQVRHLNGQTYLVNTHDGVMVVRIDEKENRILPVALLSSLHPTIARRNPPRWWIEALKRIGINADYTEGLGTDNPKSFTEAGRYTHFAFSWSDTNHNGAFDVDEVSLGSLGHAMDFGGSYCYVDADWNVYCRDTSGKSAWLVIPNEGSEKNAPRWNWDHLRPGAGVFPEPMNASALLVSRDGAVYATGKYADLTSWDLPPLNWPNNALTSNRFLKWDKDGRLLFAAGYHSAEKLGPPGGFTDLRAFVGEVRGNIVIRDAGAHAMVWTTDGLYAGNISNRVPENYATDKTRDKPSDGPWTDDCWNGQIVESPKGEVLWCANDAQNTMVIRVNGWDGWERQRGPLTLDAETASAQRHGDGLQAEYFDNSTLQGEPVLKRIDPTLWFGQLWGDHRETPTIHPWFARGEKATFDPGNCSARWTGFLEPLFTEDVTFDVFSYGNNQEKRGARVRLWIDGKLVIDSWDDMTPGKTNDWKRTRIAQSAPISLKAGQPVPIKLEYAAASEQFAHLHLYWESHSLEQRHVPQTALYSTK